MPILTLQKTFFKMHPILSRRKSMRNWYYSVYSCDSEHNAALENMNPALYETEETVSLPAGLV